MMSFFEIELCLTNAHRFDKWLFCDTRGQLTLCDFIRKDVMDDVA